MKAIYHPDDDILELRISDKPVSREVAHGWNLNISYAEDGSVVEILLLEAREQGLYPIVLDQKAARCHCRGRCNVGQRSAFVRSARASSIRKVRGHGNGDVSSTKRSRTSRAFWSASS
ncbi:MAG: DUF2283 domain-containing protein [Thiocapsa sp.]|uniref:DUF2283 domain-containing protein n=1 Tax=Thiocapsa sp. TaxID=2024551 RepID=UPI001BCC2F3B|nr:DUF2283 domain-containing protein [Thiocapsa sp.]QVL49066.1 MAG: DUF2283 domain-containing protein [Thiocapsa sp.]